MQGVLAQASTAENKMEADAKKMREEKGREIRDFKYLHLHHKASSSYNSFGLSICSYHHVLKYNKKQMDGH